LTGGKGTPTQSFGELIQPFPAIGPFGQYRAIFGAKADGPFCGEKTFNMTVYEESLPAIFGVLVAISRDDL
jgi:hypothetical protein